MKEPNGYTVYEGPSMLNGQPIIAVLTGLRIDTANQKMGSTPLQTWIVARDVGPIEAAASGADAAGCGDCKHRGRVENGRNVGRSCYVEYHWGVRNLWLAYHRGNYPKVERYADLIRLGAGRVLRLGTYGDPAAVPLLTWQALCMRAEWWMGYTHQWRSAPRDLEMLCMASVDTAAEREEAKALGWRTFRVRREDQALGGYEIACPASAEMGHRTTCENCRACSGLGGKARTDVSIIAHGAIGRIANFGRRTS